MTARCSIYQEPGSAAAAIIYNKPAHVHSIRVSNANAGVRFFQIHSKVTIPLSTEVPVIYFPVPAGTATVPAWLELDGRWFADAIFCDPGLGFAWSTTAATYTAATAGDHTTTLLWRAG